VTKPVDKFRASDVTFWGVFALCAWAVALLGATAASVVPQGIWGGLHASRLEGASLNQLRGQVAALEAEAGRLRQENSVLLQRFMLNEQASGEVTRRVGALELTVPRLLESLNARGPGIDPTTTAGIGGAVTSFAVEGGSVSYSRSPLAELGPPGGTDQPMPQALTPIQPDSSLFGLALGPPIDADEGEAAWRSMNDKVGALLLGLGPLLANVEGGSGKRLVAGPLATEADARQLCGRLAKIGIACASVPFIGNPLPLLN